MGLFIKEFVRKFIDLAIFKRVLRHHQSIIRKPLQTFNKKYNLKYSLLLVKRSKLKNEGLILSSHYNKKPTRNANELM